MSEELTAHWASSLRLRRKSDLDLTARCLRASVEQQLFGESTELAIAGARFGLRRRLGAGAMGTVYEVQRASSDGLLALKVLHRSGGEYAYRLKREFRTLSQVGHPNLVALHELYADTTGSAFTMELVQGSDLLTHLHAEHDPGLAPLRNAFAQLADALVFLHGERVIHRDLKPSNILVQPDGRVVLLDFGVALAGPELDVSGTARFMASEQRRGQTVAASDLFAVGVMLELALDARAHAGAGATGEEEAELRALCARLKRVDPNARPSARQLQHELRGTSCAAARPAPSPSAPVFVGRERELSQLLAFAAARGGPPRVASVEAGCGFGKSALLAELARRIADERQDVLVLSGRCCRRETVRYRALDPVLDALSDSLLRAPHALVQALAECVTSHLLALFPVLERIPAFTEHKRGPSLADAREQRAAAIAALRELLVRLGRSRELWIFIDDAHWLDEESSALIAELLEGPHAPNVVWLFAARPHAPALDQGLAQRVAPADRLQLALVPLSPGEA
ncbi:MAG TPA: protein kinase, partial [Polyangiales bacterium]|nr:protein kinase [Polyangiales bacterium]